MAWNKPSGAPKPVQKKPSAMRGVVAGLVVAALAAACVLVFMGKGEKPVGKSEKKPARVKEVKPRLSAKTEPAKDEQPLSVATTNVITRLKGESDRDYAKRVKRERMIEEAKKAYQERIKTDPYTADDQLANMLSAFDDTSDHPPIPVTKGMTKDFLKSLGREIKIDDSDSDQVRRMKENIIAIRTEMKSLIDGGATVEEIVSEQEKLMRENKSIRDEVMNEYKKILSSGDAEGARKYFITMDLAIQQMGISPLKMERTKEEKMAYALEKRAEREALKEQKEQAEQSREREQK